MATIMQKALQYLGLKDLEDDEIYDEEEMGDVPPGRSRTAYPDPGPEPPAGAGPVATVRPLRDDRWQPNPAPRGAVVRPLVTQRQSKPQVVAPARFSDAQEIGDLVRANHPVIVNLQASDRDLARRMIDFCSGLTYALSGSMEKVAEQVFLLTPSNVELSLEERQRLQDKGLFRA